MAYILILPLLSGLVAQFIKFFIKSNHQHFKLKNIMAYSGMPSGHTAMVVSLSTITALELGWDDPVFAITVVLAVVVIRDALGIRRYLGQHGKVLNILVKDLKEDQILDETYPHLLEQIGHTPTQVVAGALLGLGISILGFLLF